LENIQRRSTDIAKNNTKGNYQTRERELLNVRIHLLRKKEGLDMMPANVAREIVANFLFFG
jgi:hypothetical protein